MKKGIGIIFLGTIALLLFGGSFLFWKEKFEETYAQYYRAASSSFAAALRIPREETQDPLTLLFVGDIMLDRGVEYEVNKQKGNWKWPFLKISEALREADILFGNLESQISDKGQNVGSIYSFRADPKSMEALVFAGFDVVSVANNHSFDYTKEAFEDSLSRLAAAEISYTGGGLSQTEARSVVIQEIRGTKIGFLGYTSSGSPAWQATEDAAGIAWIDSKTLDSLKEDVERAKPKVDLLVISIHAGEEYAEQPIDFQRTFAKTAIDAGANLIVGHHPHVVQPLEQYQEGWIAYSLGNFLFDQKFSEETMQGAILRVTVKDKKIADATLLQTTLTPSLQIQFSPSQLD